MGRPDQPEEEQEYQYDHQGDDAPSYEAYVDHNNQPSEISINYNASDQTESQTYVVQEQHTDPGPYMQPQQDPQANVAQYPPPQQNQQPNPVQFPPPQQNQQPNPVQFPPPQQNQQPNPVQFPPPQQNQQGNPVQYPPQQNQPMGRPMTPPPSYPPQGSPMQYPPTRPTQPTQFPPPPSKTGYQPNGMPTQYPPLQYAPPPIPQSPQMGVYGSQMPQSPYKPAPGIPMANQFPNPVAQIGTEPWRSGLFDCMDDPQNAVMTACVPCLTFGQIAEIVDNGHTTCASSGLMYGCIAFLIGCPCILSCGYRTKLRSRFGLTESPAPDWAVHCLFECCALCQEYRELNARGLDPSIGWQGNLAKNNMMQQQQMGMMPPSTQTMNY